MTGPRRTGARRPRAGPQPRRMRGRGCGHLVLVLALLAPSPALAVSTSSPPTPVPIPVSTLGAARLQGAFLLSGRVTVAKNVSGEHAGQAVLRTWTFTPGCATGACPTGALLRVRAGGTDRVLLRRGAPGHYFGAGSFYAPLRCGGRAYRKGEAVPFTITVQVTGATVSAGEVVATRVHAVYTNRSRTNLTPCVVAPGHDAAVYNGSPVGPPPPLGVNRA
jgi:hypothetical protein